MTHFSYCNQSRDNEVGNYKVPESKPWLITDYTGNILSLDPKIKEQTFTESTVDGFQLLSLSVLLVSPDVCVQNRYKCSSTGAGIRDEASFCTGHLLVRLINCWLSLFHVICWWWKWKKTWNIAVSLKKCFCHLTPPHCLPTLRTPLAFIIEQVSSAEAAAGLLHISPCRAQVICHFTSASPVFRSDAFVYLPVPTGICYCGKSTSYMTFDIYHQAPSGESPRAVSVMGLRLKPESRKGCLCL